jgi:hypothetical protein
MDSKKAPASAPQKKHVAVGVVMPMQWTLRTTLLLLRSPPSWTCRRDAAKVEGAKAADAAFWRTGVGKDCGVNAKEGRRRRMRSRV